MTEVIFQIYMREHEEEYARDRMTTDQETFEEALRTVRVQHQTTLPQGVRTPDHYFFTVHEEKQDKHVGYLWFAHRPQKSELFHYHIMIKQADRRQGYGRSALPAVEQKAKELGCHVVWLNVMSHNPGAINFYRAHDYAVAAMHMNKFLNEHAD